MSRFDLYLIYESISEKRAGLTDEKSVFEAPVERK